MRKFFKDICVNNFTFLDFGRIVDWPKKQHKIRRFGHRSQPIRPLAEVVFGRTDWHPKLLDYGSCRLKTIEGQQYSDQYKIRNNTANAYSISNSVDYCNITEHSNPPQNSLVLNG